MWKVIVGDGETRYGPSWTWIDTESRHSLAKVAAHGVYVPPELAKKITEIQGQLPHDKVAFYNRALGSFEAFGLNKNGDGFEESWLRRNHDTFVKNAHYFKHHVNKDPALGRGRPVASAYNDKTAMVDLIIVADRDKCAEQIQALESGRRVPTSMGAKVAFDVCTICGNRAPSRNEYCEHVKTAALEPYGMCRVLPDGRVCGVMNPDPKFFDISDVIVGAAEESETLLKVASHMSSVISGAELADIFGLSKAAGDKDASIIKRIPGEISAVSHPLSSIAADMSSREPSIPEHVIDDIRDRHGLQGVLRGATSLGIVLKPEEFSRAAKLGNFRAPTLKEILASESAPKGILSGDAPHFAVSKLAAFFDDRSWYQPALVNRVSSARPKVASQRIFGEGDLDAKTMYTAYRKSLLSQELDEDGGFWVMKCAGTNMAYASDSSRAYMQLAFTAPSARDIVLDLKHKTVEASLTVNDFGDISGSMADDFGVEVMESITLQSIGKRLGHRRPTEQESQR
jgi:hypothetical protein